MNIKENVIIVMLAILSLTPLPSLYAAIQFSETFDSQSDWRTVDRKHAFPYPDHWDFAYTSEWWHPSEIADSQPSIQISGDNPEQVYGGVGKSFINYAESTQSWGSDGFITKDVEPTEEIYVEFKIKFQPGFAADNEKGVLKIFRVLSYDGDNLPRNKFFTSGHSAPIYVFDWVQYVDYGVRHNHAFRCDAQETNYYCINPGILNPPRALHNGDMSSNFTSLVSALNPQLEDLVNGGLLPRSGTVYHSQVYGDKWHKMAFYLKQNTYPGNQDGQLKFWLDDQLLIDMNQIPWIGPNGSMDAKWNSVGFGGNSIFNFNPNENAPISEHERWFAIDDIVIADSIPGQGTEFLESFDAQSDWTSSDKNDVHSYPANWDYAYTRETWHPSEIVDAQPSIMISGEQTGQVAGGTGKALVNYVESFNDTQYKGYTSDGSITKDFEATDELFVQFKLKFQPGFAASDDYGISRLFKIVSFDGNGPREKLNRRGHSAPIYEFSWAQTKWGVRHLHNFRCDAQESNFRCTNPSILNLPRGIHGGNMSANFTNDIMKLAPQLPDLTMEGNLPTKGIVFHDQVYGDKWHTLSFHLKQNSAPGVADGMLEFWLDEQLILSMDQIAWIGVDGDMDAKWNSITFGGVDRFHFNLDETAPISDRERWYSIDDVYILAF